MKRYSHGRARRVTLATAAGLTAATLLISGYPSISGAAPSAAKDSATFSILFTTEDSQTPDELQTLAKGVCAPEQKAEPLNLEQTPSSNIEAKVQLLASQNDLPLMYAADNTDIEPGGGLYKKGDVLDIAKELAKLGISRDMTSIAESTTKEQFQGTVPSVPFQMNIEGLFYNKKIFAAHGITVPKTFTQLLADAAKLKAAGVTPITASGQSGWPISRWVGILLFRELGPNAMEAIADGKAKLTDPKYVWAAQQIANMGKAGYFTTGITNLSYNASLSQFLTGGAAMMYMGTWLLAQINSSENTQGNNIGFMPFPAVTGGKGSISQYPANTGSPNVLNPNVFGPNAQAWLRCIAQNYGSASLKDQGTFSGFKSNKPVTGLTPITKSIQQTINNAKGSVLWFEALFDPKANADASANAAALVTGSMSPQQYMSTLQTDQTQP